MTLHRPIATLLAAAAFAVPTHALLAQAVYSSAQVAPYTSQELDDLVAPIALYPDPILAQVLVAATFPDQIEYAVRYVRANGTRGIDNQAWDVSVKAVSYYLPVLNMLGERPDWTTALGQAYAMQSGDVMDAVQRLRAMAHAQGNLATTPEQQVIVERERIVIVPAHPQVIYVPTYDPWAVYYRPVYVSSTFRGYWSFGVGFPIGAWLMYDCDWWGRRVYYDGWRGGGWRTYARPYVHITNVYVHPRYEVVYVNRTVVHRTVNYTNVRRYVHRETDFSHRDGRNTGGRGGYGDRNDDRSAGGRNNGRATQEMPPGTLRGPVTVPARVTESSARSANQAAVGSVRETSTPVTSQGARPGATQRPVTVPRSTPPQGTVTVPTTVPSRTTIPSRGSPTPPVQRQSVPPVVRQAPPPVQRQSVPRVVRQAPPPVQRQGAPPVQRQTPPPAQRQAKPPVQRQSAPPPSRPATQGTISVPTRGAATPPARGTVTRQATPPRRGDKGGGS